ncbi:MAG: hypothetical protein EP346_06880 [Bacteroidetes bacterium]|nr:MAG: hypothetical protein EP346_06880 [Bacteroidota bacterium]
MKTRENTKTRSQLIKERQKEALELMLAYSDKTYDDHVMRLYNFGIDLLDKYFVKNRSTDEWKRRLLTDEQIKYWAWLENLVAQEDEKFWYRYKNSFEQDIEEAPMGSTFASQQLQKFWSENDQRLLRCPAIHDRLRHFLMENETALR